MKNKTIVRMPSIYIWIGLVATTLFTIGGFGVVLFPKIFVESLLLENLLISFPYVLLGTYLIMVGLFWNIQVDNDSDYYIYRTIFGRTYKIFYNEISYFKTWEHVMFIKYKGKIFVVHPYAINYNIFLQMLIRKDLKKKFKGRQ